MPPSPPQADVGTGWRLVDESVDTPFDVRVVTVTAATRVWEDTDLEAAVAAAAGVERTWRFFFASRVELTPATSPSAALTSLVTDRAGAGFTKRLRDRGFREVSRKESREYPVGDARATLVRYEGSCPVEDVTLAVEGYVAVWPVGTAFLMAGGAYPRGVLAGEGETADSLRAELDPEAFRTELLELIRSVE